MIKIWATLLLIIIGVGLGLMFISGAHKESGPTPEEIKVKRSVDSLQLLYEAERNNMHHQQKADSLKLRIANGRASADTH